MIRRYCDVCQIEIGPGEIDNQVQVIHKTVESADPLKAVHLELKITRAVNGTWNGGQVCSECLRDAATNGDMKPVTS